MIESLFRKHFLKCFFWFPKFSSDIIFTRSTSAIQNQTANIISSRKRPKMTICLTSLLDYSEKLSDETPGMNETSQTNHKLRFFASLNGFLNFSFRVIFLSFVFNIPASGICIFFQNRRFKVLFKGIFSSLSVDSNLLTWEVHP